MSDLSALDQLATFKIGGGRSQPETHNYFRPSLSLWNLTKEIAGEVVVIGKIVLQRIFELGYRQETFKSNSAAKLIHSC
ncbi:hypothetical protein D3C75_443790 [compost metagenome]